MSELSLDDKVIENKNLGGTFLQVKKTMMMIKEESPYSNGNERKVIYEDNSSN